MAATFLSNGGGIQYFPSLSFKSVFSFLFFSFLKGREEKVEEKQTSVRLLCLDPTHVQVYAVVCLFFNSRNELEDAPRDDRQWQMKRIEKWKKNSDLRMVLIQLFRVYHHHRDDEIW